MYLAGEAIGVPANGAAESVDVVFDDAPAGAVWSLTVKCVLHLLLCQFHGTGQVLFVNFWKHELSKGKI